jgi:tetratricopeptide (TPR) repeat protein
MIRIKYGQLTNDVEKSYISCTMLMRFFIFSLFCVLTFSFAHAQGIDNSSLALKEKISKAKNSNEALTATVQLIDYYEFTDLVKWKQSILSLYLNQKRFPGNKSKQLIELIYSEYLLKSGNTSQFKSNFSKKISNVHFESRDLAFRLDRLRFEYEFLNKRWVLAKQIADSSLFRLRGSRNNAKNSLIYQDLSRFYISRMKRDSAYWSSNQAISFAKRSQKREILVRALQNQASTFGYFLDLEGAVQKELQAIRLAEELHIDRLKIHSFMEIARYSMLVENWSEALGYLKRANQLARGFNDLHATALIQLAYSKVYLNQESVDRAMYNALKSKAYFLKQHDFFHLAQCAHSLGNIASSKGDLVLAKDSYNQAISYYSKEKMASNLAEVYQDYGQLSIQIGDMKQAQRFLDMSVSSDQLIQSIGLIERYKLLAQISMKNGELRKALNYQNSYIQFLESNSIKRNDSKIAELTSSNLREERERLIELQQRRIEQENKEQEILMLQSDRVLYISLIVIFAIVFSLVILILRMKQVRSRQEQREAELSQTLLRTQMNPHFVFNAMSVIQSYIYENNPEKSSQFLVNFSRLMRLILENSPKEFIPIELELEILDKYLSTQKMRFENRFSYVLNVAEDLLTNKAMVPPMITQPFIENAIEHGQLHTVNGGQIIVEMKESKGNLEITISDNGIGRKKSAKTKKIRTHKSMAIDITQERIKILNKKYKFSGSLAFSDLDDQNGQGTLVTIVLPLKLDTENF